MSDDCPTSDVFLPNVGGNVASRDPERATGSTPLGSNKNRGVAEVSNDAFFGVFLQPR